MCSLFSSFLRLRSYDIRQVSRVRPQRKDSYGPQVSAILFPHSDKRGSVIAHIHVRNRVLHNGTHMAFQRWCRLAFCHNQLS